MKPKNLICILLTFSFMLIISSFQKSYGQASSAPLEFTVKSASQVKGDIKSYNLILKFPKSTDINKYSVFLYDNEPWKGGKLISTEKKVSERTIQLLNVARSKYCIIVVDEKENMKGVWFEITE